jgi:hypothetical protein
MKTFEQLKEQCTPEIIKKMSELAEGFDYAGLKDFTYSGHMYSLGSGAFPLLLHRAVEGFNKLNFKYREEKSVHLEINYPDEQIEFIKNERTQKIFLFEDYQPSHLTPCEMAILDCLIEVLK